MLLDVNFNESLTNNIVSFEQLGPEVPIQDPLLSLHSETIDPPVLSVLRFQVRIRPSQTRLVFTLMQLLKSE